MPSFKDHKFYEVTCDQIYDSTKFIDVLNM